MMVCWTSTSFIAWLKIRQIVSFSPSWKRKGGSLALSTISSGYPARRQVHFLVPSPSEPELIERPV
jgi:hypothetical protein